MHFGKSDFVGSMTSSQPRLFLPTPVEDVTPSLEFYESVMESPDFEKKEKDVRITLNPSAEQSKQLTERSNQVEGDDKKSLAKTGYTIQVGALTAKEDAVRILFRLETKGYQGVLKVPSAGVRYYRVWVGEFHEVGQAQLMGKNLRRDGFLTYLKTINE